MVAVDRLELVVVRHGLTAWNRQRRYQGRRDIPLLMPDAVPAMDRLRLHLTDQDFDAVYASDLTRCRQTLAHLSEGRTWPAPRFDARLRELDFGAYEGRTYDELKDLAGYRAWIDSQGESAPPDGESAAAMRERLSAWLAEALATAEAERHRRILAVAHGGVIRELRRRFETVDFWEGSVGQAEGRCWSLEYSEGEWQCSCSSAVPTPASATS